MTDSERLFCFGLGYSAGVFAERLMRAGWRVGGTTRGKARHATLARAGIEAGLFDGDAPMNPGGRPLAGTTHLLASIPPMDGGDPALAHHGHDIGRLNGLRWIGYLSTTGVYGNRGGGWVDESSALYPASRRAANRVAAERAWLALGAAHDIPVHIFRLAGIYGPGRSAFDRLRAGTARRIAKPGQVFSRIHVDDIATVLHASITRPDGGAIYNVADDRPAPQADVIDHAASLLGLAPPPLEDFASADLSPMARSFYADSKRLFTRRIKHALGVTLAYPDYRAGLAAILAAETGAR